MLNKNLINTEKLPPEVRKKFIPYLESMLELHQDALESVFIHGSATGKNYIPKVSDINSVFIAKDFAFTRLKSSLKIVSRGICKRISAPLFLTKNYILSSLDVFPMEFLEMKENHILLYGEDVLSGLTIQNEHMRLFCEQQIKGKLIRIRQAYLEVGLKKKGMEALLKESLNSLIPVFRNLLRLKTGSAPIEKEELLKQLTHEFDLDQGVLVAIYKDKSNDEKIANQDIVIFMEKYVTQIQKISEQVNDL